MRLNSILITLVLLVFLFAPVQQLLGQQNLEPNFESNVGVALAADLTPVVADTGDEVIQSWIEKLDSPRYRDRAQATAELSKLGLRAIDALEKTATEGGSESSDRAIEILKKHHSSNDGKLQAAATESLKRIAENAEAAKSAAAKELLEPEEMGRPNDVPNLAPQIPVFPQRNRANLNQQSSIQVTIVNGRKEITVKENGKSIRIRENQNGIEVEKDDGNGNTSKAEYKDLEELKAKDPDGFGAYEKAMPGRRMQNRANQFPRGRRGSAQNQNPNFPIPDFPVPNFSIPDFPEMGPGFPEPFDHQKFHQELLDQHQRLLDRMEQFHQPGFPPVQPVPKDSLPEDVDPESKQPLETKIIESLDV